MTGISFLIFHCVFLNNIPLGVYATFCLSVDYFCEFHYFHTIINKTDFLISFSDCSLLVYRRRRQWHPTSVLLPGKSHGWRSLVGCSPWGCYESDSTEQLHFHFTFMHWRRKWQPTPVFLPGDSQGRRSLVGCYLWGRTELDTTEAS